MTRFALYSLLFVTALLVQPSHGRAAELIFVHSPGCHFCNEWRKDVGSIYHKTEEAQRLSLREVNLLRGMPDDLAHLTRPTFTPTFIVLDDNNQEVGRILGYNEEFFWGFLQSYIQKMDGADPAS